MAKMLVKQECMTMQDHRQYKLEVYNTSRMFEDLKSTEPEPHAKIEVRKNYS